VPVLMFTGGPCRDQSTSALMAELAADLGVPWAAIVLEDRSRRTRASAVNAEPLLTRRGLRSVVQQDSSAEGRAGVCRSRDVGLSPTCFAAPSQARCPAASASDSFRAQSTSTWFAALLVASMGLSARICTILRAGMRTAGRIVVSAIA